MRKIPLKKIVMRKKFYIRPGANDWMLGLRWDPKKAELLIGGPKTFEEQMVAIAEVIGLQEEHLKERKLVGGVRLHFIYVHQGPFNFYAGLIALDRNLDVSIKRTRSFGRLMR